MQKEEAQKIAREILENNGMGSNCVGPLVEYIALDLMAAHEAVLKYEWDDKSRYGLMDGIKWAIEQMKGKV